MRHFLFGPGRLSFPWNPDTGNIAATTAPTKGMRSEFHAEIQLEEREARGAGVGDVDELLPEPTSEKERAIDVPSKAAAESVGQVGIVLGRLCCPADVAEPRIPETAGDRRTGCDVGVDVSSRHHRVEVWRQRTGQNVIGQNHAKGGGFDRSARRSRTRRDRNARRRLDGSLVIGTAPGEQTAEVDVLIEVVAELEAETPVVFNLDVRSALESNVPRERILRRDHKFPSTLAIVFRRLGRDWRPGEDALNDHQDDEN